VVSSTKTNTIDDGRNGHGTEKADSNIDLIDRKFHCIVFIVLLLYCIAVVLYCIVLLLGDAIGEKPNTDTADNMDSEKPEKIMNKLKEKKRKEACSTYETKEG